MPRPSPLQLKMAFDSHALQPLSVADREQAALELAKLLLLAAGVTLMERNDDEQR